MAHEDSARRAVAAALGMQVSLEQYGSEIAQRHGVTYRFRVGLNTGPVVVGTVTDDLQMNFRACQVRRVQVRPCQVRQVRPCQVRP